MWSYVSTILEWLSILCAFIDDVFHMSWIYFLKENNETFNKFQEFKALVENQNRKHICALRSDNGGELESHDFK